MTSPQTAQVLIIDNDLESSRIIHRALQESGHQAHLATESQIAIDFAHEKKPEIVILDNYAHFGRGLELIPTLFEASATSPVVVTTSDPTIGAEIAAREAGAFDVLVKPFRDIGLLALRLNIAVQTSRALRDRDEVIKNFNQNSATVQQLQAQVLSLSEQLESLQHSRSSEAQSGDQVLNETAFMQRLHNESARALRYSRAVTAGLVAIDGYPQIFRRFGEDITQQIRANVAEVIKDSIRSIDITGEFSSGEIGFILPETDKSEGYIVAERIRAHIEQTLTHLEDQDLKLTVTVGFASLPSDTMNSNGLLASARGACQAAASIGVNQVMGFRG